MPVPAVKTGSRSKKGPRLIIIVRHAQSEGNKNREIHQTVPDHRVKLTSDGQQQAREAGKRLRAMLRADDTLHFFTSPYRRTRETTEGILQTLTSDDPEPSPFKRNNIKVYEEPRLREQDFGNFQPCSAEMERMWQERADYGHFFYRIPNGESAADAYDRVSGFNESLWRQFGEDDFASVCVLVTHGLMSRVFLMKWYHFSVEYFEDLRNINHCEFLIMRKQEESGKYILENKLRTWSELRRERAALLKQKEEEAVRNGTAKDRDAAKLERAAAAAAAVVAASPPVPQRRWGGCPNGCNHDKNFKIRSGLADLIKRDGTAIYSDSGAKSPSSPTHGSDNNNKNNSSTSLSRRAANSRRFESVGYSDDDDGGDEIDDDNHVSSPTSADSQSESGKDANTEASSITTANAVTDVKSSKGGKASKASSGTPSQQRPKIDVLRAREEIVSSPDATPSFITPEDRLRTLASPPPQFLHVGRDFGGTYSGHTSDADSSEDDRVRSRVARLKLNTDGIGNNNNSISSSSMGNEQTHYQSFSSLNALAIDDPSFAGTGNSSPSLGQLGQKDTIDRLPDALANAVGKKTTGTGGGAAGGAGAGTGVGAGAGAGTDGSTNSPVGHPLRRRRTMANRLGDAPHCSDCEHGDEDLSEDEKDVDDELREAGVIDDETDADDDHELHKAETEDKSIRGSVY